MEKTEKKLVVSDKFLEIYKNFNVSDQIQKMGELSKKELYLLLILSIDKFDENCTNPTLNHNLSQFKTELGLLYKIQDDVQVDDEDIKKLIEESGDSYIETDFIVTNSGKELPKPLTIQQARDKRIGLTLK